MNRFKHRSLEHWFELFLSSRTKEKLERYIIGIAIISFIVHLALVLLGDALSEGILEFADSSFIQILVEGQLFKSPVAAIYTPFSFILLYEVYLLVYYLPKSISSYIRKQYEIITLIVIRRIFKDMANLDLTGSWVESDYDLQLTYDLLTTLVLFLLIFLFTYLNKKTSSALMPQGEKAILNQFLKRKKTIAVLLIPILLALSLFSFGSWVVNEITSLEGLFSGITDINKIFFNEFFTVLILADVLLLLFSLYYTDRFDRVIRNSGFIISTILLRLSFGADGLTNNILICAALIFGVLILLIYNLYGRLVLPNNADRICNT
jgi:hypothetical protein